MRRIVPLIILVSLLPLSAAAQERETPYWASLRYDEVNMRVGPGNERRIDWVYKRKGLPVKVIRLMDGWRLIEDPDGTSGWVVSRLLTPERSAIVIGKGPAAIRAEAAPSSPAKWQAEPGVVGKLGECDAGWCLFDVAGRKGYVLQDRLWGAGEP